MTFRRLLVPLDGSEFAEQALFPALSIARRAGAAVELAHVIVPVLLPEGTILPADFLERGRRDAEHYLDQVRCRVQAVSSVPVTSAVLEGEAAAALTRHLGAAGTDLVVMATHGRGAVSRFWLGSVADELVRTVDVPVLLFRPRDPAPDLAQDWEFRHVLIPLDGSDFSEQVLEPAIALGSLMNADYRLLRVVSPVSYLGYYPTSSGQPLSDVLQAEARQRLQRVVRRLQGQSLSVHGEVIDNQPPAAAILDVARRHGSDLIALTTHGHGRLGRMFLGSVADKVARGAEVPVLIHRPG